MPAPVSAEPPWQPVGPPAGEVRVPFGGAGDVAKVCVGALICLLLGGGALYGAIFGKADTVGGTIAAGVIGAIFFLGGLAMALALPKVARHRYAVMDAGGFTWDDPKGRGWKASWPELTSIRVTTAYHQNRMRIAVRGKRYRVRLIVTPVEPKTFAMKRPQLAVLRGKFGAGPDEYGIPLGAEHKKVPALADGLQRYAGRANGGVVEEGRVMGFGYA